MLIECNKCSCLSCVDFAQLFQLVHESIHLAKGIVYSSFILNHFSQRWVESIEILMEILLSLLSLI